MEFEWNARRPGMVRRPIIYRDHHLKGSTIGCRMGLVHPPGWGKSPGQPVVGGRIPAHWLMGPGQIGNSIHPPGNFAYHRIPPGEGGQCLEYRSGTWSTTSIEGRNTSMSTTPVRWFITWSFGLVSVYRVARRLAVWEYVSEYHRSA